MFLRNFSVYVDLFQCYLLCILIWGEVEKIPKTLFLSIMLVPPLLDMW